MEVGPMGALKPRAAALAKSIFGLDESASVGTPDARNLRLPSYSTGGGHFQRTYPGENNALKFRRPLKLPPS